uniref:Intraflagellar transport protein 43 homolog n=1 Tax=Arion vulgaris TaxID=1028688 RepID=A0A0B6XZY1_9EUPU
MEDGDLSFGSKQKKKGAKTGRRAAAAASVTASTLEEEELASEMPSQKNIPDDPPEKPSKAVSGWSEDAPVRKPRMRQLGEGFENLEDDRLKQKSPDKDDDNDDDIPVIPELEDQQEDELASTVAAAPNVVVNRVATYRELDSDLLMQAAFLTLDNEIDLKLLTKVLSLPEDIIEDDKSWDWNRLFTEISSELRTELETTDDLDEEKTVVVEQ